MLTLFQELMIWWVKFQNIVLSILDLKSAYHQVPLPDEGKPYTAFEATSKLYEFYSLSFGLTNGAAAFQRSIDVIEEDELENPFAYVDNITVCSMQIKRSMTVI